jgi:hypothetical protein
MHFYTQDDADYQRTFDIQKAHHQDMHQDNSVSLMGTTTRMGLVPPVL